jgi:putative Holliday junction resolvase
MRVLGLDLGDRRIGVALSDDTGTLASGLPTVTRVGPKKDLARIMDLVRAHGVSEVVVGLPLNMDGSAGPAAEKARAFVAELARRAGVPVALQDERLTTVEAEERLREAGVRREDWPKRVDQAAAVIILQEYLDARRARAAGGPA